MKIPFVCSTHIDRVALIDDTGQRLTYSELADSIAGLRIAERGLLFLVGDNDVPSVRCYLGALAHNVVPLLLSAHIPEDQLQSLIAVYQPRYVFLPRQHPCCDHDWHLCDEMGRYGLYERGSAATVRLNDDLALLLPTSGSTGSPKLVRLTMSNLETNAISIVEYLGIDAQERAITSLPFSYSYGMSVLNSHLLAGASLVLTPRSFVDPLFWKQVNEQQVTSIAGVPYSYEILLKLRLGKMKIPSVKTFTQAGGRLDSARIAQIHAICEEKGVRFFTMYGQTEASPRIAFLPPEDTMRKLGSIGRAIPRGRLWLERDDGTVIDTPGEVGELIYAGPNVSMGYALSPADLALGDVNRGILKTGDMARADEDGYYFIEGRRRRFLKIFGVRVSLDAVEQFAVTHGQICAAGGCDDRLVLYLEGLPAQEAETFRLEMARSLGLYPGAVRVQTMEALPRLPTGKINYQLLSRLEE